MFCVRVCFVYDCVSCLCMLNTFLITCCVRFCICGVRFVCDLRMVGVSCLCIFHYLFNEPVVRFSAFVLCVLCVCVLQTVCVSFLCSSHTLL